MFDMNKQRFGERITELREALGLSKYRLAQLSDVSESLVGKIESGKTVPEEDTIKKLAPHLGDGVNLDELLAWADAERIGEKRLQNVDKYVLSPRRPQLGDVNKSGDVEYPPTDEEKAVLQKGRQMGLSFDTSRPGFWSKPPEERREFFRDFEDLIREFSALTGNGGMD